MSGRNDNAFDRQLAREIDRLAGPEPRVDVREIVERAAAPPRRRTTLFGGNHLVTTALAVIVVALGVLLVMSGVLDTGEDLGEVGASPTATTLDERGPETEPAAAKVDFASGTFVQSELDWDRIDAMIEAGELPPPPQSDPRIGAGESWLGLPVHFTVNASDPRLDGEAVMGLVGASLDHTVTVDDLDVDRPFGLWRLDSVRGRLQIRNDRGSWEGTVGPAFGATGEDPSDGVPGNAESFAGGVPAVLNGSGEYDGLTAYVAFRNGRPEPFADDVVGSGAFEAVIVNAAPLPTIEPQTWDGMRTWVDAVRDAGAIE